jgi:hypothetical protein
LRRIAALRNKTAKCAFQSVIESIRIKNFPFIYAALEACHAWQALCFERIRHYVAVQKDSACQGIRRVPSQRERKIPMSLATYDVARKASVIEAAPVRGKGLFARLLDALIESRMRRARDEIARHRHLLPPELEQAGWKLSERSEDSLPFMR